MAIVELLAPALPGDEAVSRVVLAPRRALAAPARVLIIDNGKPRTVELMTNIIDAMRGELEVGEVNVYFKGAASRIIDEQEAKDLAVANDLVIAGLGDCGACSANSLADALRMENAGIPATVVITEPFTGHITSWAVTMGAPGYHFAVVPHPVSSRSAETLKAYGTRAAGLVRRQLTEDQH
jgi:hypothetical protein